MKPPRLTKTDTQGNDYQANNLLLLRDPSLRAFAQDDKSGLSLMERKEWRRSRHSFRSSSLAHHCHPERSEGSHQ